MEGDLGCQARNLVVVVVVHIRENSVSTLPEESAYTRTWLICSNNLRVWNGWETTYRWNLAGQINVLGQAHLALLERAFQVRLANRLTQVRGLVNQSDQAVFDLEMHITTLNLIFEVPLCLDRESRSRLGRVRVKIYFLDLEEVVFRVGAEVQRVVSWYLVVVLDGHLAGHPRWLCGDGSHAGGSEKHRGELHDSFGAFMGY